MSTGKRKATSGHRKGKKAKFEIISTGFDEPGNKSRSDPGPSQVTVHHVEYSQSSSGRTRHQSERVHVFRDPREDTPASEMGTARSDSTAETVDGIMSGLPVADGEDLGDGDTVQVSGTRQAEKKRDRSELRAAVCLRQASCMYSAC